MIGYLCKYQKDLLVEGYFGNEMGPVATDRLGLDRGVGRLGLGRGVGRLGAGRLEVGTPGRPRVSRLWIGPAVEVGSSR